MTHGDPRQPYAAVLFDLLTAVLDSWTLWNEVAGGAGAGTRWRHEYLELTYGQGDYVPYEGLVGDAAENVGLPRSLADDLAGRWQDLRPWPEAPRVLEAVAREYPIGVVTNCSQALGVQTAEQVSAAWSVGFATVVTAERAGSYKPRPAAYLLALEELQLPPECVLFVAGSRFDLPGATGVGMDCWWHNRTGMRPTPGSPIPLGEADTLTPLLGLLGLQ